MYHQDLYHTIALLKVAQVGDITARTLIAQFGTAEAVFRARRAALQETPNIGKTVADNLLAFDNWQSVDAEMAFLEQHDIRASLYYEKNYPQRLTHFADAPTIVYQKGRWDANEQPRIIGIIGTRKPTQYGIAFTERLVAALKPYNVTIISGLAYGIDGVAHRSALEQAIPTVGVLAHGLKRIYPPAHQKMAQRMWQEEGALLTEFTSDALPDRENFPRRNRIVAGLCDALVIAETAKKGGSMITAAFANDYNKDVFALPGRINEEVSGGCNLLIKSHKAALIEGVEDLVYVLRWGEKPAAQQQQQMKMFVELTGSRKTIADLLNDRCEHGIDALAQRAEMPVAQVSSTLLTLEFDGLVRSLPGKRYVLA